MRGYRERDRVRVTWLLADADHETTVQFTVSPSGTNTVLRFHQAIAPTGRACWRP